MNGKGTGCGEGCDACRRVLDGSDPSFERDGVIAVGEVVADETPLIKRRKESCLEVLKRRVDNTGDGFGWRREGIMKMLL